MSQGLWDLTCEISSRCRSTFGGHGLQAAPPPTTVGTRAMLRSFLNEFEWSIPDSEKFRQATVTLRWMSLNYARLVISVEVKRDRFEYVHWPTVYTCLTLFWTHSNVLIYSFEVLWIIWVTASLIDYFQPEIQGIRAVLLKKCRWFTLLPRDLFSWLAGLPHAGLWTNLQWKIKNMLQ